MTKEFKSLAIIILLTVLITSGLLPAKAVHAAGKSSTMTVGASSLNVRISPSRSAKVIASLKRGTKVQASTSRYGWTYVQANRTKGWVSAAYLIRSNAASVHSRSTAAVKNGVVTGNGLRLRKTPSLNGKVVKTLSKGTKVAIAKKQSSWLNVKTQKGYTGWVSQSYVKTTAAAPVKTAVPKAANQNQYVTVLANGVNLRKGPGTGYMVVGYAQKGERYRSLGSQNNWIHIVLPHGGSAWVAGWLTGSSAASPKTPVNTGDLTGKTIVVDAGHGGFDSGAIGAAGSFEKNAALSAASALASKLRQAGANVIMTRQSDVYLTLSARTAISASNRTDAFISLHYNSSTFPSVRGLTTYYYSSSKDKPLAQAVQSHLISSTGRMNDGVRFGDFHVLRENPKHAILVELGFISNYNEEFVVTSQSFQNKAADGIVAGLEDYFN